MSGGWSVFWDVAKVVDGVLVWVAVLGEGVSHIPNHWLPTWMWSPKEIEKFTVRAWLVLVAALVVEVPIDMARDRISATLEQNFGEHLSEIDKGIARRHLTISQQAEIAEKIRKWAQVLPGDIPSITPPFGASQSHWNVKRDEIIQRLMQMAFVIQVSKLAESASLAADISTALTLANWDVDPIEPPPDVFGDLTSKPFFGVHILASSNPRAMNVATDLKNALTDEGISASLSFGGSGCQYGEAPYFNNFWKQQIGTPWCSLVLIIVGDHP